jgi:hypothetical protein
MFVLAIVLLNKRLLKWWKSVSVVLAIIVITAFISSSVAAQLDSISWINELKGAISGAVRTDEKIVINKQIDYFETHGSSLDFSIEGVAGTVTAGNGTVALVDAGGVHVQGRQDSSTGKFLFDDARYENLSFHFASDEDGMSYMVLGIAGEEYEWPFALTGPNKTELLYRNPVGKLVSLNKVPHFGFENKQGFGSGRGYIWSRSIPMLKDTLLVGHGADSYILHFPQNDYAGKYSAGWGLHLVVDKPHNIYLGTGINTGVISLLALLALFGIYIVQSFKIYRRDEFDSFASFVGAGIFIGVCGFLVSGIVNDSTVSVMPMFYALLGTGIAVNIMRMRG